jgi:RNA polymerase sigma factor for flagellar operon FliA
MSIIEEGDMKSIAIYEKNANLNLEKFVQNHLPLVKKIALYMKRRLPSHIEFDDLLQSGLVGLLEAKDKFDPTNGATFSTYASMRIRGAIVDSLRKNSWATREALKSMKLISGAIAKIEQRDHRRATTKDIVSELGITSEQHLQISQDINMLHITSLNYDSQVDAIVVDSADDPERIVQQDSIKLYLKKILKDLPKREQLVLSLYYIEELTFKKIGEVLNLTEARICQLHAQSIIRIRNKMQAEK